MKKRSKLSPKSSDEGNDQRTLKSPKDSGKPDLDETLLGMSEAGILTGDVLRNLMQNGASVNCLDEVRRRVFPPTSLSFLQQQ
jgi:hypothetical protein